MTNQRTLRSVKTDDLIHEIAWPRERAILAPDHKSFLDGPAIAAAYRKSMGRRAGRLMFGVETSYARHWLWRQVLRAACAFWGAECVPIGPSTPFGIRAMIRHVQRGGVACIFPSGAIGSSATKPGLEFISKKTRAPVIRVRMRIVRGSGRYAWTAPATTEHGQCGHMKTPGTKPGV